MVRNKKKTTEIGERLPIKTVEKNDWMDCEGCVFKILTPLGQGCTNQFFECIALRRDDERNVKFVLDTEDDNNQSNIERP